MTHFLQIHEPPAWEELDRAHAELAVRGSRDGLWDWDIQAGTFYFSPRWKSMLGYEDHELPSHKTAFTACVHPDDRDRVDSEVNAYLAGEIDEYEIEFRMRHRDGDWLWILARGVALRDAQGVPYRMAGSHTDITARKQTEVDLRQARDAAEATSRAKSQFLANMSHELRTPMNAILGFSEILQDETFGELNARQAKYMDNILTSGRHLLGLINDILDLSKIEAGHMALHREPFDAVMALEDAQETVRELANKKDIALTVDVEGALPLLVGDVARFRQILFNLLSNAIKFTPEGGAVRVGARGEGEEIHIWVTDTGIGLSPESLERIWGEFEQVDSSYTRRQQGTGLGLALTRRLVELQGGRIWAESDGEGRGSAFHLCLPLAEAEPMIEEKTSQRLAA